MKVYNLWGMETSMAVVALIEACIFLIPLGTLFIKIGKYAKRLEVCEKEIKELEEQHNKDFAEMKDNHQSTISLLNSMCVSLGKIEKTVELLLSGKISVRD